MRKKDLAKSISLSRCLLLLVTLELNEVLIVGVPSLSAEINIYRLYWICYSCYLTAKNLSRVLIQQMLL